MNLDVIDNKSFPSHNAVSDTMDSVGDVASDTAARVIFGTRWGLAPLSIGLSVAIGVYVVKFAQQTWHLVTHCLNMSNEQVLLDVLEMIDSTMVATLVVMILIGCHAIFVDKHAFDNFKNRPNWLKNITTTSLKINIGKSLMSVSSVSLLKTFMEIGHDKVTWDHLWMGIALHMVFCITTLFYAWVEKVHHSADQSHALTDSIAAPAVAH